MQVRIIAQDGESQSEGDVSAKAKTFSTGSDGFNLNGKVTIGGVRYQVSGNMVRVGSAAENAAKA